MVGGGGGDHGCGAAEQGGNGGEYGSETRDYSRTILTAEEE